MKRYFLAFSLILLFSSCDSSTYENLEEPQIIVGNATYETNVKSIIDANCIVCHSLGGSASFRPLTTFTEVRNAVLNTNLLQRIQLQNGEPGQMPQSGRMSQDKINTILQWNSDGLLEN